MAEFSNRPRPVTQMPQFPSTESLSNLYLREGDIQAQSVRDIGEIQARTAQNVGTGISEGLGSAIQHYQEAPKRKAEAERLAAAEARKVADAEWDEYTRKHTREVDHPYKLLEREAEEKKWIEDEKLRERAEYTHTQQVSEDFREENDQYRAELGAAARNVISSETFTVAQVQALKQHMDLANVESQGFFPCIESGDPACPNLRNEIADLVRFSEEKVDPADLHRYRQGNFDPVSTSTGGPQGPYGTPTRQGQFSKESVYFRDAETAEKYGFPASYVEVPFIAMWNWAKNGFQTGMNTQVIKFEDLQIAGTQESEKQMESNVDIARVVALGEGSLEGLTTLRGQQRSIVAARANQFREEWGLPPVDFIAMKVNQVALEKWAGAMNSFPKYKWLALSRSVRSSMNVLKEKAAELKQGGLRPWNLAMRKLETQTELGIWNPESGLLGPNADPNVNYAILAAEYEAMVVTTIELYANLIAGANAPTNQAFELAMDALDPNMSYAQMEAVLDVLYQEISIREMSLRTQTPTLLNVRDASAADLGSPALDLFVDRPGSPIYDEQGKNLGTLNKVGDKRWMSAKSIRDEMTKSLTAAGTYEQDKAAIDSVTTGSWMQLRPYEGREGETLWVPMTDAQLREAPKYNPNDPQLFQLRTDDKNLQRIQIFLDNITSPVRDPRR